MEYPQEFIDIIENPKLVNEFIGYGNPSSEILIVGQEAALTEGSEDWAKFYAPNHEQWARTYHEDLHYKTWDGHSEYKFPEFFNPIYPYYKQYLSTTSRTWLWYQKLVDNVFMHEMEGRKGIVDFFKYAFITELNNHTRPDHSVKQNLEENIRERFDFMRVTAPFWSRFKFVILANGSYSDAIDSVYGLKESIFGEAHIERCKQLSRNYASEEVKRLSPIIRDFFQK